MKEKTIILVLVLILTVRVAGATFFIPPEVKATGAPGEELELQVTIFDIDYTGQVEVKDYWAPQDTIERNQLLHNLKAGDLGINITYDGNFTMTPNERRDILVTVKTSYPGRYHGLLVFKPTDSSVSVASGTWLYLDTRAPLLTLDSPSQGNTAKIRGYTSSDTRKVKLYLEGEVIKELTPQNGEFQLEVPLSGGSNRIWAVGVDKNGTETPSSLPLEIVVPDNPPSPPVLSQVVIIGGEAYLYGTAEKGTTVEVRIGEESQGKVESTGSFSMKIHLKNGDNYITAIATDKNGRKSEWSKPLIVNPEKPETLIETPLKNRQSQTQKNTTTNSSTETAENNHATSPVNQTLEIDTVAKHLPGLEAPYAGLALALASYIIRRRPWSKY